MRFRDNYRGAAQNWVFWRLEDRDDRRLIEGQKFHMYNNRVNQDLSLCLEKSPRKSDQ